MLLKSRKMVAWLLITALFISMFTGIAPAVQANTAAAPNLSSPIIGETFSDGAMVTFNYQAAEGESNVIVKGSFHENWADIGMVQGENHVWSHTRRIAAGWYQYGIQSSTGWKADPLNEVRNEGNPGLAVPGIRFSGPGEALIGQETVLQAVYYTGAGATTLPVTFSLEAPQQGVSISNNKLVVTSEAAPGQVNVTAAYEGFSVTRSIRLVGEALRSPVVAQDGTVTFNVESSRDTLYLVGSLNGWDINNALEMNKANGIFSITRKLAPGKYEYKFVPVRGSWSGDFIDPLNSRTSGGNSVVIVPGIKLDFAQVVESGKELTLTSVFVQADGTEAPAAPQYTLKAPVNGVSIENGKLVVASTAPANAVVTVVAQHNGYTSEREVTILSSLNTYTIHYYRYDNKPRDWNMWIWHTGENGRGVPFTETTADGYAKAVYQTPAASINVITRLKSGDNEWSKQEDTRVISIPENGTSAEVWLVEGLNEIYTSKPDLNAIKPVERKVKFTYQRPDQEYTGWNIWAWSTGKSDGQNDFTTISNGAATAYIPISSNTTKMGFKLRKGTGWDQIDQNFDREIITGTNTVTKVIVYGGQGEFKTLPSSRAPYLADGNATFTYRDETLFNTDEMHLIESVTLRIGGQEYPMTYVSEDELFVYTLRNLKEGTHPYTYLVTRRDGASSEITDPRNTVNGLSAVEYKNPQVQITSQVTPAAVAYNENAVLALTLQSEETAYREMYADLSALGGKSKTRMDPELRAVSIAVSDAVTSGVKAIPVTIIDLYGNKHQHQASLTVKPRQYVGSADFDWDEARIYFMLTDRFADGDSSNNDPNGEKYDTSHPETYHGGDLKGITQNLGYLSRLGINTIWITPIVDNIDFNKGFDFNSYQYGYHGYWAKDFTALDEHLGSMEDLHELIDAAHERGIKIMVDVVLNHTGYGLNGLSSNWSSLTNLPTAAEMAAMNGMFRTSNEDSVIRYSLDGLPDFRTEDPVVRNKIIEWQTAWIEKSRTSKGNTIDYFRVDTVKHVEDTTWMAFKNALTSVKPDFKMIGEHYGASVNSDGGYLQSGMMDSLLDFRFKGIARDFVNGNVENVQAELEQRNSLLNNTAMMGQFLSSHDEDGFLYSSLSSEDKVKFRQGTLEQEKLLEAHSKHKIAASLQITAKGQPVIYYGEELGYSGKHAGDMSKGEFNENRDMLDFGRLDQEIYASMFEHYEKLLNIRKNYSKVFSKGTRTHTAGSNSEGYLVFQREYQGDRVLVGINTLAADQPASFAVPYTAGTKLRDVYNGKDYTVTTDGKVQLTLPSRMDGGTVILVKTADPDPVVSPTPTTVPVVTNGPAATPSPTPAAAQVVKPEVKTEQGRKVATVDSKELETAVQGAVGSGKAVQIQVPNVKANETLAIALPGDLIKLANKEKVALQIVTEGSTITLPAGALPADASLIEVSRGQLGLAEQTALEQKILSKDAAYSLVGKVYQFHVKADGQDVTGFNGKVQVTLEPEQEELAALSNRKKAGAYYASESGALEFKGGKWQGNKFIFETDHFSSYMIMEYNKSFLDVKEGWSKAYIELLAARQIVKGTGDSLFQPQANVTRGEFAALLGRALGTKEHHQSGVFADVQDKAYYAGHVGALHQLGLINGYTDGTFKPEATITREEMVTLMIRAYVYLTGQDLETVAVKPAEFADLHQASSYAIRSIQAAGALGMIHGIGQGQFAPKGLTTREQAAKLLVELLELSNQL